MYWGAIVTLILASLGYTILMMMIKFGVYKNNFRHYPGECRQVKGLEFGSEDLQVTSKGHAFVTSGLTYEAMAPGYKEFLTEKNIVGRIYLVDLNSPTPVAQELKIKPSKEFNPETFHPHGLSLLEDTSKGEHLLYVVNHPDKGVDHVEKFRYLPKSKELEHVKSIASEMMWVTNDLAVTSEDKFYISNYMYSTSHTMGALENLIPISIGSVLFYNGTDFSVVESGLRAPNGLLLSKDGRFLYVSHPMNEEVLVYERKGDNSLTLVQAAQVFTFPDNLHLTPSGDGLLTGAHPVGYKIFIHLDDPHQKAPSSAVYFPLKNGQIDMDNAMELFYDHGDLISGSSVAAVYKNKLLIGSIINKLVLCDINIKF